ncbi:DUF3572 domain-containing protein [Lacibacterium aquatile]|uniref:DUF3572 domain-containing protein n=1 Tax=Lacibacterium aquatile TaxID=1168082 RepID=A0ABW5DSY8_9PROT
MAPRLPPQSRETAETLALRGIGWIAGDDDMIARFLSLTGIDPSELRHRLGDPAVLAGVLDFLLGDEATLIAFCHDQEIPPEVPGLARRYLPGAPLE